MTDPRSVPTKTTETIGDWCECRHPDHFDSEKDEHSYGAHKLANFTMASGARFCSKCAAYHMETHSHQCANPTGLCAAQGYCECVCGYRRYAKHSSEWIPASRSPTAPTEETKKTEHPEARCQRCGRPNVWSWHAPSPLWNAVMRNRVTGADRYGIVCPPCFAELATVLIGETTWCFKPHDVEVSKLWTDGDGRTWDDRQCLWIESPRSPTADPEKDFEKLLDAIEVHAADAETCECFANDCVHTDRLRAARQSLVDYVERLRADGVIAAMDLASSKRHAEILSAELASLRDSVLTPEEAKTILDTNVAVGPVIRSKLRLSANRKEVEK